MLSLFMSISGGVSWENVISPLKKISTAWVVVYLFYISFTYFAVLNVVTADAFMHLNFGYALLPSFSAWAGYSISMILLGI